jgi:hypothetical protein
MLVGSAGGWVCTASEEAGRGAIVLSGVGTGAVPVAEPSVGGAAVDVCTRVGVGLPPVDRGVGEGVEVAGPVAVAVPVVGRSVGVKDGANVVGEGVSEGTPGGSVGVGLGGGSVGLVAVGVFVAPVGVIVGMVWFR